MQTQKDWLSYFERNRARRMLIPWECGIIVEPHLRDPLIRSLQRFQVGEQGDGRHLRMGAAATGDPAYVAAMALFVEEEQEHARLLARLIEAEAGAEPQKGKVAVGAVVMNRVHSSEYPKTIRGVIFDKKYGCQFEPVCTGYLWDVTPSSASHEAARAAIGGEDPTYGATRFFNAKKANPSWARTLTTTVVIGNHRFMK